jgi:arylsulfatase A-like enzyme
VIKRLLSAVVVFVVVMGAVLIYRSQRTPGIQDVLLITIDTLRADHLGCYGYRRDISPNLDRYAAEGVLFENAFCVMPTTLPSHASILTGTWPRIHGSTNNHVRIANKTLAYLPRAMKEAGYATGAYVSAFHLADELKGLGGFDVFDAPKLERPAEATLSLAQKWLAQNGDRRFFLWVHLWDPHSKYFLHPEFMKKINPDFKDDFEKHYTFLGAAKYTPDQLKRMIDLYDNEIAYTDFWLGKFMDEFRRSHPNTLIVIVADHGETLDELVETQNYGFDHGEFLLDQQIHVPMIVLLPQNESAGTRVRNTTSLIDVFPTILDFLGIKEPSSSQGNSLKAYILKKPANRPDSVAFLQRRTFKVPPRPFLASNQFGVLDREYKLLLDLPEATASLFKNNDRPVTMDAKAAKMSDLMQRRLKQWLDSTAVFEKQPHQEVSPETSEKLKSLGYVQ